MDIALLIFGCILALAALLVPGWLVAWGLGIQGALRLVTAPALSLGIWSAATWIAIGLQLPWRWWLALPLLALVTLPFVVGRLVTLRPGTRARWPRVPQTRLTRPWWVVAVVCGFMSGLPYLLSTHAGARVAQTWDVVFHLSAIRYTRERASASPWVAFAPLNGGHETYYPNIFHNLVALLPGSPVTVYTVFTVVMLVLWPLMMGAFTLLVVVRLRGSTPASYFMSGIAQLGAAMGVNFPTLAVANYATPPYNLTLVAMPGLVILGVTIYRLRPRKLSFPQALYSSQLAPWLALGFIVGLVGVACTHPASVFNLLLFVGIPTLMQMIRLLMRWQASRSAKILLMAVGLAGVITVFLGVLLPRFISMSKFANPNKNLLANVWRMLADRPQEWVNAPFGISGLMMSLAAFCGAVLLWRARRLRWLIWGFLVAWVFFLLAAGPVWPGYFLTTPWYLQPSRLSPLVLTFELPLAAYGFMRGLERLEAFYLTRGWIHPWKTWQIALVVALLVTSSGATVAGRVAVIAGSYDPTQIVRGTMLSESERDFIHQQAPHLPSAAVIWGAPHEGTPYWWILEDKRVVFPSLSWPRESAVRVLRDLAGGSISLASCKYLQQLGVTHYYVDNDRQAEGARFGSYRWVWREKHVSFKLPENILNKVAENRSGSGLGGEFLGQRLYKVNLEACSGE